MTRKVKDFEVSDLGIKNPQYFHGYGVAFTPYTHCCYGIGDNPREALDDCLEQCAQCDVDTEDLEARIIAENDGKPYPETPSVYDEYGDEEEENDGDVCELYYHVGIRWTFED